MMGRFSNNRQDSQQHREWLTLLFGNDSITGNFSDLTIYVGLTTEDASGTIRQNYIQIGIMSAILLLVGLGGYLSLMFAQGYRASQHTLKHMQAFHGLLLSRLPDGIMATDSSGNIKTFNGKMEELVNKSSGDVINRKPKDILPESLHSVFTSNEDLFDRQLQFIAPSSGKEYTLSINSMAIIDKGGTIQGKVLLVHDLSEIKRLEKDMRRNERLAALGKMAAGVAHEVRNPLSSIKGFATLLGSRFSKDSEEKKAATLMIDQVDRLNRSISELLQYTRPLPLTMKPVTLNRLISEALHLMETDATDRGVTISFHEPDEVNTILADKDRLNQVLLNLFLNGLQAMPEGGILDVKIDSNDKQVTIIVSDNGCGIPPDHMNRIIDPYFTTKPEGTGLGLAMVNKIIDEHGGTLSIESEEGRGTKVSVVLNRS